MPNPRSLLVILDGFGIRHQREGNAIALARTPHFDRLHHLAAHARLVACGRDVGLPDGLMGSSEVGHLNIGAGRIVAQDVVRVATAVRDGSILENPTLTALAQRVQSRGRVLHVLGLCSDGGVHALDRHIEAVVELGHRSGLDDIRVHAFLDGRDTPPRSAREHVQRLERALARFPGARIATVCGRYFAMDRDNRWPRIERAWRALVMGEAPQRDSATEAIDLSYSQDVGDEFLEPVVVARVPRGMVDGDGVVFVNFRADRARQLTRALFDVDFDAFDRPLRPRVDMVTMTQYDARLPVPAAFPPLELDGIFADVMAAMGVENLRVAETEKYAHVTYFFNGRIEQPRPYETRILVPSLKVSTYDLAPEMSAVAITDGILAAIGSGSHQVIVANYANADMVGHTGVLAATVQAVEVLDREIGRLLDACGRHGFGVFVTADHGNAEQMLDQAGQPHTAHTTNPVPFYAYAPGVALKLREEGRLADVVPTILDSWGHGKPTQMTGESLLRS